MEALHKIEGTETSKTRSSYMNIYVMLFEFAEKKKKKKRDEYPVLGNKRGTEKFKSI